MALVFLLSIWQLTLPGQAYAECGPSPIFVPVTNVKFANGNSLRGALAGPGTPPQNVSLLIDTFLNNTWIYNTSAPLCQHEQPTVPCFTDRGGLYDPENSTTSTYHKDVTAAGGDSGDIAQAPGRHLWVNSWSNDDFRVGNVSVHRFPLGMPGLNLIGDTTTQGVYGLGQNSTLLQQLKDEGRIASRSYSFWWGDGNSNSRSAIDGHIILGGYDAAKLTGTPYTGRIQPSSNNCRSGMSLTLTSIVMNFPNGSTHNINSNKMLPMCVGIDQRYTMSLPWNPYFEDFETISQTSSTGNSHGYNFWMPTYLPSNVYSGDLEIQIQGGPAIVVPNDVLVVPDLETDVSGATHRNDSLATLLINPLDSMQIEEGGTVLGMDFFANAYLIVNLDDSSWSLWPANRTTDARLVTIGNKQCDAANNESLPPNAVNSTKPASTASSTPLSSGAIAGIAVGSIAGLLLIVGLVVLAIRRRKSQGANHGEIGASETWQNHPQSGQKVASSDTSDADHRDLHPAEMTGNTVLPAELHVTQEPAELPRRYTYKGKPGYTLGDTAELPTTLTPRM